MDKHYVFMRDVVTKFHPSFVASSDLRDFGLKQSNLFNIERLIEESLAAAGGYNFVNEDGRDFDCPWNSDSKTASMIYSGHSKVAIFSGIENKIGSLRCVIYNPFKESADYIYFPKEIVKRYKEPHGGKNSYKERIRVCWNEKDDHYNSSERFRVADFRTLAKTGDDCF